MAVSDVRTLQHHSPPHTAHADTPDVFGVKKTTFRLPLPVSTKLSGSDWNTAKGQDKDNNDKSSTCHKPTNWGITYIKYYIVHLHMYTNTYKLTLLSCTYAGPVNGINT